MPRTPLCSDPEDCRREWGLSRGCQGWGAAAPGRPTAIVTLPPWNSTSGDNLASLGPRVQPESCGLCSTAALRGLRHTAWHWSGRGSGCCGDRASSWSEGSLCQAGSLSRTEGSDLH